MPEKCRLLCHFWVASVTPAWKWLVVTPLAIIGFLQLIRDEVLTDETYKTVTVYELFDRFLPHWSLAVYVAALLGVVFLLVIWGASNAYVGDVSQLQKTLKTSQNARFREITDQYDALAGTQQRFWEILGHAHSRWLSGSGALEGLIEGAHIPSFLSQAGGGDSLQAVQAWAAGLAGGDLLLWRFVSQLYASRDAGKLTSNILSEPEFAAFHSDRRSLVKFWNKCGDLLSDGELPIQKMRDRFVPGQNRLLTVLVYLHLRVKVCLETEGAGAQAIYQLPGRLWDVP